MTQEGLRGRSSLDADRHSTLAALQFPYSSKRPLGPYMGNTPKPPTKGPTATAVPPPTAKQDLVPPDKKLLFIEDQVAAGAEWNTESLFVLAKRFCGGLKESETEERKQRQKINAFVPGIHNTYTFKVNQDSSAPSAESITAATTLKIFLRRHMYRMRWRDAVMALVKRLRDEQRHQREEMQMETMIARFREILLDGLTASKVSVQGNLKTVTLRLVVDPSFDACYMTWTPSKKRNPRVMMHEIDYVVPARQNMKHVPVHLLRKVSLRRTFVICMRASSAAFAARRMVLQVANSKERDFMVKGFQRYLENRTGAGYVDDAGVPRMDQRKAALAFFNPPPPPPQSPDDARDPSMSRLERLEYNESRRRRRPPAVTAVADDILSGDDDEDNESDDGHQHDQGDGVVVPARVHPVDENPQPLLSHFYSTRFDEMDMKEAEEMQARKSRPVLTAHQERMLDEEARLSIVFANALK
ncbi:Aste57867_10530 [Aphanomyces stellatus]|uniref:Aste57867_10530 protein n=1 Tax=Aphanomyces stellatus TaxID=120398 RepID=A0A485KRW2_9STRA|nr:hypothetical protein As57867_010490 [Aphanomyces stellatus]VFT87403.1 Aste57867_10530 [Aphanomyces stellatus]